MQPRWRRTIPLAAHAYGSPAAPVGGWSSASRTRYSSLAPRVVFFTEGGGRHAVRHTAQAHANNCQSAGCAARASEALHAVCPHPHGRTPARPVAGTRSTLPPMLHATHYHHNTRRNNIPNFLLAYDHMQPAVRKSKSIRAKLSTTLHYVILNFMFCLFSS